MTKNSLKSMGKNIIWAFILLWLLANNINAQKLYTGDPVTKNGLLKALKLRQFQTADIVKIINQQGVEFRLTPEVTNELIKAGARTEIIDSVRKNFRGDLKLKPSNSVTYENLISKAISIYQTDAKTNESIEILNAAIRLKPNDSRAYQMLGFVTLYGQRNFKAAEEFMRKAINFGGSAVFRVSHSHDYTFTYSCQGSFYITNNAIRFEDDENIHTFQVSHSDITELNTIGKWTGLLKRKSGLFKVIIRDKADVKDKDKYDFSPLTGKSEEAKMIIRLIGKN